MLARYHRHSPAGLPRPRWAEAGMELAAETTGPQPPRGSRASADVIAPCSSYVLRGSSPPKTAAESHAAAREGSATARGRGPRRRRLRLGFARWVLRQRRGGGKDGMWAGEVAADRPPCRLGLGDAGVRLVRSVYPIRVIFSTFFRCDI
jgi:hypothetical protein